MIDTDQLAEDQLPERACLLLWWLGFPSAKQLAEWGYRMIARHRYQWFGEAKPLSRQN